MKSIKILFFGKLKEVWLTSRMEIQTGSHNIDELYAELLSSAVYEPFKPSIKVAVNDEFCEWDTEIQEGDEVAFLPPASGG